MDLHVQSVVLVWLTAPFSVEIDDLPDAVDWTAPTLVSGAADLLCAWLGLWLVRRPASTYTVPFFFRHFSSNVMKQ